MVDLVATPPCPLCIALYPLVTNTSCRSKKVRRLLYVLVYIFVQSYELADYAIDQGRQTA
jgi:hypothetical protein